MTSLPFPQPSLGNFVFTPEPSFLARQKPTFYTCKVSDEEINVTNKGGFLKKELVHRITISNVRNKKGRVFCRELMVKLEVPLFTQFGLRLDYLPCSQLCFFLLL